MENRLVGNDMEGGLDWEGGVEVVTRDQIPDLFLQ